VFENYPKTAKLVHKNFPLRNHTFAFQAAVYALAADRQGKFWEFHDELYKNYNQLNEDKIRQIAQQLGLDLEKLNIDIRDPKIKEIIIRDYREGVAAGVRGIPTIFINGRLLRNRSLEGFRAAIEKELKKTRKEQ